MRAIALFGMSGSGKSHLTHTLAAQGFSWISIDQIIQDQLNEGDGLALDSLQAVAEWMGFPDSPTYRERSRKYGRLEARAVQNVISQTGKRSAQPLVIDTTGSVIYLEADLLDGLKKNASIIHLETPRLVREEMLTAFRNHPTPLIWDDCFEHREGEDVWTSLVRSYPVLVERRESEYARWGDLTLGYDERRRPDFDPAAFLEANQLV